MSSTTTVTATCKHCGQGTVTVKIPEGTGYSGGSTGSSWCPKCNKTSSFSYTLSDGKFSGLR